MWNQINTYVEKFKINRCLASEDQHGRTPIVGVGPNEGYPVVVDVPLTHFIVLKYKMYLTYHQSCHV